jgi:hypothetical protein
MSKSFDKNIQGKANKKTRYLSGKAIAILLRKKSKSDNDSTEGVSLLLSLRPQRK